MHEGMFQRLINYLTSAFDSLAVQIELGKIEELAVLIHKAMTYHARKYHNLDHVFTLVDESSPIITLAALFHDLIYCQVDMGFLPEVHQVMDQYVLEREDKIWIIENANQGDRLFQVILDIFDYKLGQFLEPVDGLNEFLSALVMAKKLEWLIDEKDLFDLILCVESSIPFRESAITGTDYFYTLEQRALNSNQRWELGMSPEEIQDGVKTAVIFANRDVGSFAEIDVSCYLETTWKLLPEMNPFLRSIEVYSIRGYRQALQSMEISMSRLNPDKVFHQYRGEPSDLEYQKMVQRAHQNVQTGQEFLRIKLLTQAILEALAEETGGDAPLSLFMGDLPGEAMHPSRLEDFLPETISPKWIDTSTDVYKLLSSSRGDENKFDLRTSPLSLFVYKSLTPEGVLQALDRAREMFENRLSAHDFLFSLDQAVLSSIALASYEMVLTRRDRLLRFAT